MSTEDNIHSAESEEADEEQSDEPIAAVAPVVNVEDEIPADVFASPAFQSLDELFNEQKLSGTHLALLKSKYTLLHETLKSAQESEIQLMQEAKRYAAELDYQRNELDKADHFPESYSTEVSKLRRQLLDCENDLAQKEDRVYQQQYKIKSLTEEKTVFESELEKQPKVSEFEKKAKAMKEACEDLRKEITHKKRMVRILKEDIEIKNKQIEDGQKELQGKLEIEEQLQGDVAELQSIPGQLSKDMEKINRRKINLEKKKAEFDDEIHEIAVSLKQIDQKSRMTEDERITIMKELEGKRVMQDTKEREINQALKISELYKDTESALMGERASLELKLRHIQMDRKTLKDALLQTGREKDRFIRNLKKKELQLKVTNETLDHIKMMYNRVKSQAGILPKDDGTMLEKRNELQSEVKTLKKNMIEQLSLTELETHLLHQCTVEEDQLLAEQRIAVEQVLNLARLSHIRNDEKDQKARDLMNTQHRYEQSKEEKREKDLAFESYQKKFLDSQTKLREFAKAYQFIKNERNKYVNLTYAASLKIEELTENIKAITLELELRRNNSYDKTKELQKEKLLQVNSYVIRDSLRRTMNKTLEMLSRMREKTEEQSLNMGKLSAQINQTEADMVRLRKRYEMAVQNRNERGIQLIQREEEVCIFYEKVNIQDSLLRNGDLELNGLNEEVRFLKIQISEEERHICMDRKILLLKQQLDKDLITQKAQLSRWQITVRNLEERMQNPAAKNRARLLEGKDPSFSELTGKIDQLDLQLARKEEQLLEKDLICEQVRRFCERIRRKTENGKQATLDLAKQINELQRKIREITRKMMSVVSELSMQQANAIKLQQEASDKQEFVEACYLRLEQNLAPCEEYENEWLKIIRNEERYKASKAIKAKEKEEEDKHLLASGIYTTADPRPNAYIPDDDSGLPLPRPYGNLAPFKPSEPGANMRHFRKPTIKPIEI
ncbi:coiled-coil domain-containing protein 146 isoform X1 [Callorhinchus milii]|nr:coiled-coil domain-containing protein 146 isoform X1 [Callorhinchus milii]XP_042191464.1 coiled-coil domain-containing protein 146 isoform X1 [Callorhinchus milii]|eukprot:gi/632947530/ref/XP_007889091.1/ PREDICTED: coiled-coil domain-containing protein 146 [Callorhinchus milii]